jgi:hypothetical protein
MKSNAKFWGIVAVLVIASAILIGTHSNRENEDVHGPFELFCMVDGVASHQSDTFEQVSRPRKDNPFAWELSGDGLTGWTWVYHQKPGESCVVRESARAWMKAEPGP